MRGRLLLLVAALCSLLALPALASAAIVYEAWTVSSANNPLYLADDDGGNATKLPATGQFPVVSPNGASVVYEKVTNTKTGASQLLFLTIATGADFNTKVSCSGPVWAPNSSAVACTTTQTTGAVKGTGLSTVSTTGTVAIIVPSVGWQVNGYSWSPDSSTVIWGQTPFGSADLDSTLRALPADVGGAVTKLGKGFQPI